MSYSYSPRLIKKLEQIVFENPDSTAFSALAQIYLSQGKLEKAKKLCLSALRRQAPQPAIYVILAEIHKSQGQIPEALKALNSAKKLNPDHPKIYKIMADIHRLQNNGSKTLSALKMLNCLQPEDRATVSYMKHLAKLFDASSAEGLQKASPKQREQSPLGEIPKRLSIKQAQKLSKLNKIMAQVENHTRRL